ncbi:LysR family transcriptional regulator [Vibrio astriarenae]|uniref:LysR family transcriptional regulator n=1 Tax=Vibrio astriarenae TaxID=1481923 RepID=A0A7Z2T4D4_9VIBR|nr:LysR family transcriptional regulator [Vibrio astriarenae]QIA64065.1 LysR family transcriptional regulator [Vibrio astriarenae]
MSQFSWKGVDLNLLVSFQAIYRHKSVSLAAENCYVSQSAMSHSLQRMRNLFDDPLFDRVGSKMEPTTRAVELAPVVEKLLTMVQSELLPQRDFESGLFTGVCRIGLTDYAEQLFAPLLFDAIKEQAPNCQISFFNVNRSNYIEMIETSDLDIVIGSINVKSSRYLSELLYTEEHLCLFDPTSVNLNTPISLEAFASYEHALVSPDGQLQTQVDKILEQNGLRRRVGVSSRHFLTIRRLLLGRSLLCIVPKRFAEMEMDNHDFKALNPPVLVPKFDICLLYPKSREKDDKGKWLRDIVHKVVK